jgi:hypothetical protein
MKLYRYSIVVDRCEQFNIKEIIEVDYSDVYKCYGGGYMTSQARDLFFHDEQVNKGVHITFGNNYGYNILQLYEDNELINKEALKKQVKDCYIKEIEKVISKCNQTINKLNNN